MGSCAFFDSSANSFLLKKFWFFFVLMMCFGTIFDIFFNLLRQTKNVAIKQELTNQMIENQVIGINMLNNNKD